MAIESLKLNGNDAKTFIERQASSNQGYAGFLSPQARIIALGYLDFPYLITNEAKKLKEHLEKFIIVEDVVITLDCHAPTELAMTFEPYQEGQTLIQLLDEHPGILEKYVDFSKGCFPGQEPLSKFKNIGLKKREQRSQEYLDQALEIFAKTQSATELDPAIDLLRKALKENPRNEDAMESLGVLLAKQEKFQEAIAVMHQLELINPQNQMAQMNLSIFYMKIGDKERAEEHKAKGTVLAFDEALK